VTKLTRLMAGIIIAGVVVQGALAGGFLAGRPALRDLHERVGHGLLAVAVMLLVLGLHSGSTTSPPRCVAGGAGWARVRLRAVVAGPGRGPRCLAGAEEVVGDIPVGVEHAHRRNRLVRQLLLTSSLTPEAVGVNTEGWS
jgi:hypothetical protein